MSFLPRPSEPPTGGNAKLAGNPTFRRSVFVGLAALLLVAVIAGVLAGLGRPGSPSPAPRSAGRGLPAPEPKGPELVTGRHFLQEDSGAEIAVKINNFLDRIDGKQP